MKIAVIGYGYVGKAIVEFLGKAGAKITVVDPAYSFFDYANIESRIPKDGFKNHDLSVVCVPTNSREDGTCDTSIVEDVVEKLKTPIVLIKSTIPPGTTKRLQESHASDLVFSPEFIGESRYQIHDYNKYMDQRKMELHPFYIFGGPREATTKLIDLWKRIAGYEPRYMQTDSTTAELVKYGENSFLMMKVLICNEWYDLCELWDVDYNEFIELLTLDERIGKAMTMIWEDKRGVDSKCIPKDPMAIVREAESKGHIPLILKAGLEYNKILKKVC